MGYSVGGIGDADKSARRKRVIKPSGRMIKHVTEVIDC
jgi:hypothetical protein